MSEVSLTDAELERLTAEIERARKEGR